MKQIEQPKTKIRERLKNIGKESWALSGDLFDQMKYRGELMAEKHKEKKRLEEEKAKSP